MGQLVGGCFHLKGVADFEGVLVVVDVGGIEIVVLAVVFLEVGQDVG